MEINIESVKDCCQNVKKKVGRKPKPMSDEDTQKKHAEILVKRRQYAKTYYDKKFKFIRQLMELNDKYNIPEDIKNLPQDTAENAEKKVQICKEYIQNLKAHFKQQLCKNAGTAPILV